MILINNDIRPAMLTFLEHRRIGDRPVRRTFIPADRPGDGKHGEYNFFGTWCRFFGPFGR
jgi:hypothetical protein